MRLSRGLSAVWRNAVGMVFVVVAIVLNRRALRGAVGRVRIRGKREITVSLRRRIAWDRAMRWLEVCWLGLGRGKVSLDQRLQVRDV